MRLAMPIAVALASCAGSGPKPHPEPKVAITPPQEMCPGRAINEESFCLESARIERLMKREDYRVVEVNTPGRGTTEMQIVTLEVNDGGTQVRFRAKFKPSFEGGEGFNNNPRKELAAYRVQKLFLEPHEYVVPPTVVRCVPLDRMEREHGMTGKKPTFEGTSCVLAIFTYWMENVTSDDVFHVWRFEQNSDYRRNISNLNLLTFIIDHRDTHDGNFLISTDLTNPRVFAVDNGLAFSGLRNPVPILQRHPNWAHIVVPALPREKIEIIRGITRAQLDELGTTIQLAPRNGMLREVESEPPFDPEEGVRVRSGVVQMGLKREEIDGVEKRIRQLLEKSESGEVALYE